MEYKITHCTIRIIPKEPVNREAFYTKILKVLGLKACMDKFINTGGNKHYFSVASYSGVNIKLPFYETMEKRGFVLEITKHGLEFLFDDMIYSPISLIETLSDEFISLADVFPVRIDIETDYIPPHVLAHIPSEFLKNDVTAYIGSLRSFYRCIYSKNKVVYSFIKRGAKFLEEEMLCYITSDDFKASFKEFLDNWKPRSYSFVFFAEAKGEK